jgi:DinB superfamily
MSSEASFVDVALRSWKSNVDRAGTFFGALSPEELQKEVAPGKNRLIYIWGHLAAVNDRMLAILGLGERLHPELDAMFLSNPDKAVELTLPPEKLKHIWDEIDERLWTGISGLSPSQWLEKHTAVSDSDYAREPHRNRFAILLSRTTHLAYHLGQAVLTKQES